MTTSYIGGSCTTTTAPSTFLPNETYVTPYTVTTNGTIVSACFRVRNYEGVSHIGHITLMILRPNGTNWDYVGESPSIEVAYNTAVTVTTNCNIPVQNGDRIGWYADGCNVDLLGTGLYNYFSTSGKQTGVNFSLPNDVYRDSGDAGVVITFTDVPIQPTYTHILEFRIRPWGWYTPNGAASALLLKMNDINGWSLNLISGLTDWQYVQSDIITDGNDVLIQCKFKNLSLASATMSIKPLVVQLGAIIETVFMLIGYAVIIFLAVGYMTGFKFFGVFEPPESPDSPEKAPTYIPPPKDQEPGIKDTVQNQKDICLTGLPITPTCAELSTYSICLKAAHVGVYGTLKTIYPNFTEFQTTYNKYLDIYTDLVATCNPSIPGSTPADILQKIIDEQQKYIVQIEEDFKKLQVLYEQSQCCIELPFLGCAINKGICDTARTVAYVIIGGIGVYLIYDTYTKVQPMLSQSNSKKK